MSRHWLVPALTFLNVLAGTLLIPVVRPFFAAVHQGSEGAMHAFMSVNMLGAALGAPALALVADRTGHRRAMAVGLAAVDGLLLLGCSLPLPLGWVLGLRFFQGAAAVGALSIAMGSAGSGRTQGSSMGMVGAALVAAIAVGAPVGALLLRGGPAFPLWVGAGLSLVVALGCVWLPAGAPRAGGRGWRQVFGEQPLLRWAAVWVGAERFAVGCFVVTFSLYAHHVLGLSDARVGGLFTWFLLPFALLSWPVGRLADRLNRAWLLGVGIFLYGLAYLLLPQVPPEGLAGILVLSGAASSAIYSPALCVSVSAADPSSRATAMGMVNAAGTLGMMLGTALAGIMSAVLQGQGVERAEAYGWVFRFAGLTQLVVLSISFPVLKELSRAFRPAVPQEAR